MTSLERVSISIEKRLLTRLEKLIKSSRYTNRSEFIRDMIRSKLVEQDWANERREVIGTITLIYDHHRRELSEKLTDIQHDHHDEVLASTHVHIAHDRCAEMIMVKGRVDRVRALADRLHREKGVLHAELSMSATGDSLR